MHEVARQITSLVVALVTVGAALGLAGGLLLGDPGMWVIIGAGVGLAVAARLSFDVRAAAAERALPPGEGIVDSPRSLDEAERIRRQYRVRRRVQRVAIVCILSLGFAYAAAHEYLDRLAYFKYPPLTYLVFGGLVYGAFHRSFRCPGCEHMLRGIGNPMVCTNCGVRLRD